MTSSTTTPQELAYRSLKYWTRGQRDDGSQYLSLTTTAPEWLRDLVRDAHGVDERGATPDDWRHEAIYLALNCIAEADDPEDAAHEWADGMVAVYNADRVAWLGSHVERAGWCDAAQSDGMVYPGAGIMERIGAGMYREALEVFELVRASLEQRAARIDEASR